MVVSSPRGAAAPLRCLLRAALPAVIAGCGSDRDLFEQTTVDLFRQAPNNEVDILWVVDDSHSMLEEQATLEAGFGSFADQIEASGTDFHLGVITTSFVYSSPDRGVLVGDPPFLTNEDDYVAGFTERAQVGNAGSDKEKGLEAALYALQPTMNLTGGPNEGFVRREAQLLVVIVSDEEDCSDRGRLEGQSAEACYRNEDALPDVSEFVREFRRLKVDDDLVQLGAIVGTARSTCPDVYEGGRYVEAVRLMGGIVGDICESDWSGVLSEFGVNATGIRSRFQLSKAAIPETIEVRVAATERADGTVVKSGWTYDSETWFLEFAPEAVPDRGSFVTVSYSVLAGVPEPPADAEDAASAPTEGATP